MHYHCEIIIPNGCDVYATVKAIMDPFCEHNEDSDYARHAFWDWYRIGGRWSGEHIRCRLDPGRLEAFEELLRAREVTVSSFRAGKPSLSPSQQRHEVDALWREHFPESGLQHCPLFAHFESDTADECPLSHVRDELTCERLMIARFDDPSRLEFMLVSEIWNGVTHQKTQWDSRVATGLELYAQRLAMYTAETKARLVIPDDALIVTVDYHS